MLVVDDGSRDGTAELLAARGDVQVVTHPQNRGYGAALQSAFDFALQNGYDVLVTIDCDGQHQPCMIPRFVAKSAEADIVSGSRYLKEFPGDSRPPEQRRRINRAHHGPRQPRVGAASDRRVLRFQGVSRAVPGEIHIDRDGLRHAVGVLGAGGGDGADDRRIAGAADLSRRGAVVWRGLGPRRDAVEGLRGKSSIARWPKVAGTGCKPLGTVADLHDRSASAHPRPHLNADSLRLFMTRTSAPSPTAAICRAAREPRDARHSAVGRSRGTGGGKRPGDRPSADLHACKAAALPTSRDKPGPNCSQPPALGPPLSRRSKCRACDPSGLMFLAGHQPELFHPGVWFKNFALGELARRHGAAAINLVIDSDMLKSTSLGVPCCSLDDPHREAVLFDRPDAGIPFEERPILDESLFCNFGRRVAKRMAAFVPDPLIERLLADGAGACPARRSPGLLPGPGPASIGRRNGACKHWRFRKARCAIARRSIGFWSTSLPISSAFANVTIRPCKNIAGRMEFAMRPIPCPTWPRMGIGSRPRCGYGRPSNRSACRVFVCRCGKEYIVSNRAGRAIRLRSTPRAMPAMPCGD